MRLQFLFQKTSVVCHISSTFEQAYGHIIGHNVIARTGFDLGMRKGQVEGLTPSMEKPHVRSIDHLWEPTPMV